MKVKYEDRLKQKLLAITTDTLVVGVDIAKNYQWARFVDYRGIEHNRALKLKNSRDGFETILARIREICKGHGEPLKEPMERPLEEKILQRIRKTPSCTYDALAESLEVSRSTVKRSMKLLAWSDRALWQRHGAACDAGL